MTDKNRPENRSKSTESGAPTARSPVRSAALRSIQGRDFPRPGMNTGFEPAQKSIPAASKQRKAVASAARKTRMERPGDPSPL